MREKNDMISTPICDFARAFAESKPARFHMPGHKGEGPMGVEGLDITEVSGADVLYPAKGIIRESEENAARIFGSGRTIYSVEGSSLCIRAMVYLAMMHARLKAQKPLILAGRNAHKTFLSALALTDVEVEWYFGEQSSAAGKPPLQGKATQRVVPSEAKRSRGISPKGAEGLNHGIFSCIVSPARLEEIFLASERGEREKPSSVYITSPDYLGQRSDIAAIAEVCHRHGALLLVDNAHGAYLKFVRSAGYPAERENPTKRGKVAESAEGTNPYGPLSLHPMDLGADMACDSAHKTLRVLTGGAYLHLSKSCPPGLIKMAERGLQLFASTSPSYLIMQSLDAANIEMANGCPSEESVSEAGAFGGTCNKTGADGKEGPVYMDDNSALDASSGDFCGEYRRKVEAASKAVAGLKERLSESGWESIADEPLKLTLCPKSKGYRGDELAEILQKDGLIDEFSDPDYIVYMFSAANTEDEIAAIGEALMGIPEREPITDLPPILSRPERIMSPREAMLSPFETVTIKDAVGRILATPSVGCPPAIPIAISGERIDSAAAALFEYYGIETVDVVME